MRSIIISFFFNNISGRIEVAVRSTGEKGPSISLPPGGGNRPYGIVVVPDTCPRGIFITKILLFTRYATERMIK